jgi:hypothetical protein
MLREKWPNEISVAPSVAQLRLICMGKGFLAPDTKSIKSFKLPVFKTHPTPINVSVRPEAAMKSSSADECKKTAKVTNSSGSARGVGSASAGGAAGAASSSSNSRQTNGSQSAGTSGSSSSSCFCVIM